MTSAKAWEYLSNFESFELVKNDYSTRHWRALNTRPAREISAPFSHARSYFTAASNADLTVKPLLLYYGVVSLSRGLTLLRTKGLREASLAPTHGLSVKSWGDELSKENFDVAALKVAANSVGTFREICKATGCLSLLRYNNSGINFNLNAGDMTATAEYSLGDILCRIPDLSDQNHRWRGIREALHLEGFDTTPSNDTVRFKISKRPGVTREVADRIFLGSDFQFLAETTFFEYQGSNNIDTMPGITDKLGTFGIGDFYAVRRYPASPNLNKIAVTFILSYILGMFVRYYPTQWTALIRGQVADAALPTLLSAVDYVENSYPSITADFIEHKVK